MKDFTRKRRLAMGTALSIVAAIGLAPWRVVAQTGTRPAPSKESRSVDESPEGRIQGLARELDLRTDQTAQVRSVAEYVMNQAAIIKSSQSPSAAETTNRIMALCK